MPLVLVWLNGKLIDFRDRGPRLPLETCLMPQNTRVFLEKSSKKWRLYRIFLQFGCNYCDTARSHQTSEKTL